MLNDNRESTLLHSIICHVGELRAGGTACYRAAGASVKRSRARCRADRHASQAAYADDNAVSYTDGDTHTCRHLVSSGHADAYPLDDTYGKLDPSEPEWWICRRCPDYLPAGGNWRLQFDKGVYRIYYEVIQWRSLGSFVVSGDRIYLFNDPYCQWDVGEYRWKLEDRKLTFEVIEDPCSFKLRAANLTGYAWVSCQPPNREAAISDHWIKPAGCER